MLAAKGPIVYYVLGGGGGGGRCFLRGGNFFKRALFWGGGVSFYPVRKVRGGKIFRVPTKCISQLFFSSILELVKSTSYFSISLQFFRATKILHVIG